MEADLDRYRRRAEHADNDVPSLRSALAEAQGQNAGMRDEVAKLQALLRCAQAAQAQDDSIDKRLVASVLIKYLEHRSDEVLAVLASMLGCSLEERRILGLLPRTAKCTEPRPDAKLSDMWIDFLVAEADGEAPR